jgi:hypothetical protein
MNESNLIFVQSQVILRIFLSGRFTYTSLRLFNKSPPYENLYGRRRRPRQTIGPTGH